MHSPEIFFFDQFVRAADLAQRFSLDVIGLPGSGVEAWAVRVAFGKFSLISSGTLIS